MPARRRRTTTTTSTVATPTMPVTQRLLVTRQEAARMLSCSCSTLWRMEKENRLRPIKLSSKQNGQTFYASTDLLLLASGR